MRQRGLRVVIVGTSGAGKTTLARRLAAALSLPHVELDALYWGPGWTPKPADVYRALVSHTIRRPEWVMDGNHSKLRDLIWPRATHLIWLNYPFPLVFARALRRTLKRVITGEDLFAGNRETLRKALLERDSIPRWVIRTHYRRRREYRRLFDDRADAHLQYLELVHPAQAESLLAVLSAVG